MYSDDDEDGVISAGGAPESRTRRVSEGSATNTTKPAGKSLSYNSSQGQMPNRGINNTTSTAHKEKSKPLHPLDGKHEIVEKERRSNSPVKPSATMADSSPPTKTSTSSVTSNSVQKRNAVGTSTEKTEIQKAPVIDSGNDKSPSKTQVREEVKTEPKVDSIAPAVKRPVPLQTDSQKTVIHGPGAENMRQKGDDDLDRMKEEADALVAKLMADEESHREKTASVPPSIGNQPSTGPSSNGQEKWFYRDPQGEVQGPFLASEMAEWCKAGYFTAGLMVRRTCDERYTTLGELMKICGRIPFTPGPPIPPLKVRLSSSLEKRRISKMIRKKFP